VALTVVTGLGCIKGLSSHDCVCPLLLTALQLIRSPAFNRAVHKAYRKINRLPDMEAKNGGGSMFATQLVCMNNTDFMAGTGPSSLDHFKDELKTQLRELTWQKRPPK
jgi:hypothetical protein